MPPLCEKLAGELKVVFALCDGASLGRDDCLRAAVIDVGTNSIKLAVGERTSGGAVQLIAHATTNPRLGEGVDETHVINPEAVDRALAVLRDLLALARQHGVQRLRVVGTSALRDAENRDKIIERVRRELGLDLEVLSEKDECRFSYLAVALDPVLGDFNAGQVVADVGGGSSELTFGSGPRVIGGHSVRIGAVRLTERHLLSDPPTARELRDATEEARKLLSAAVLVAGVGRVVGVGGSAVNLARVLKEIPADTIEGVHGTPISRSHMQQLVDRLAGMTVAQRRTLIGLEPERADIILGGAVILNAVMTVTGADELVVSLHGLRLGILYDILDH